MTEEQRSPEPKIDVTLRAVCLFRSGFVARSLQTPEGYARRSRLVWAKNPSPQTWSYLWNGVLMQQRSKSVFGKWFPGSTGDPPVPSGDPPDGTETTIRGNENGLFATWLSAVPVGGSPTGAGESPAPPIFKTRAEPQEAPVTILSTVSPSFQIGAKFRPARFSRERARPMRPRMIFPAVSPGQTDQGSPALARSGHSTQSANARC